jgi:hypothetical protein
MPVRPEGRLSFRQFLRLVRENTLGTYPPEAFDDEIIAGRLLWRRRLLLAFRPSRRVRGVSP